MEWMVLRVLRVQKEFREHKVLRVTPVLWVKTD
jgi:hypothetical protein